jgi:hypothetical protein
MSSTVLAKMRNETSDKVEAIHLPLLSKSKAFHGTNLTAGAKSTESIVKSYLILKIFQRVNVNIQMNEAITNHHLPSPAMGLRYRCIQSCAIKTIIQPNHVTCPS